jgi:4a-hydroxytetrahydrobiopterin dehydratase
MERLTDAAIQDRLQKLDDWSLDNGAIQKVLNFPSFLDGMDFVNRVATLSDVADHHPDILIQYRTVTLRLTTHSAGGLTDADFDLAAAIDGTR